MVARQWNFHRLAAVRKVWAERGPPVFMSVAAYLGLNKPEKAPEPELSFEDLMQQLAPGGVG